MFNKFLFEFTVCCQLKKKNLYRLLVGILGKYISTRNVFCFFGCFSCILINVENGKKKFLHKNDQNCKWIRIMSYIFTILRHELRNRRTKMLQDLLSLKKNLLDLASQSGKKIIEIVAKTSKLSNQRTNYNFFFCSHHVVFCASLLVFFSVTKLWTSC